MCFKVCTYVHVCVPVLWTTAVQWDTSSLFWILVQFPTHIPPLHLSLALVWLIVRDHDSLYSPYRTDLTVRKKINTLNLNCRTALCKRLFSQIAMCKSIASSLKSTTWKYGFYVKFISGVRAHQEFYYTIEILFILARKSENPCLLCSS